MKDLRFETAEEMATWVIKYPNSDTRYTLEEHGGIVGETKEYYLSHKDGSWNWNSVELSNGLGEELAKVWPTKPRWYGSSLMKFSGARTLAGVLKLLGRDDITTKVKEAKANEKSEAEKRRRDSYRRVVNEKLVALVNAVDEANKVAGLHFELPDFSELLSLLEEEA